MPISLVIWFSRKNMLHLLHIYRAQLRVYLALQMQYRVGVLISMIGTIIRPTIYLVVWATVARESGGAIAGRSVSDFAAYYLIVMFLEHLTYTWMMFEFDYLIRHGEFSHLLLRPVHPFHADLMNNIAFKLIGLLPMIPVGVLIAWAYRPNFQTGLSDLLLFIPVFFLTFALRFCLGYTLGMAAFWTNRISALTRVYFLLTLFFSGRLTPLELLPAPLQTIADILPFKWFVAFPVDLLLGRFTLAEALQGMTIQALWVAGTILALRFIWQRGTRKYAAFGS